MSSILCLCFRLARQQRTATPDRVQLDRYRVALPEGDRVLIKAPKGKSSLHRFTLDHFPAISENLYSEQKEFAQVMGKRLQAYVETGILTLRVRRLGLTGKP